MMLGNLIAEQFGPARNWPLGSAMALFLMLVVMIALVVYNFMQLTAAKYVLQSTDTYRL